MGKQLDIGDSVCDMHYGLPKGASNHVCIKTPTANSIAEQIIRDAINDDFAYCNKIAHVVDCSRDGAILKCVYAYDGETLGFFHYEGNGD